MKTSEYLAEFLRSRGVRQVLGLPGTETIELIEGIRQAGLEFVLTQHEATAAFTAAMIGHLTGVPGVCLVAGGPGTTNTTSGVYAAHLDRMPLCVIIGDHVADPSLPTHQRLPFGHVAEGVARDRYLVDPSTLAERLPPVFDAAAGTPPGPVLVSVPTSAMDGTVTGAPATMERSADASRSVDVDQLAQALRGAKRIFCVIGLEVTWRDEGDGLRRLIERLQAPVADTPQSKGWFPNDHPLYLGTYATRRNAAIARLADQADLVLAIGLDSVELLSAWRLKAPVVALGSATAGEPAIPASLAVNAPLGMAIDALLAALPPRPPTWPDADLDSARHEIRDGLWPPGSGVAHPLWPQEVVAALQGAMPGDGVVTSDIGSHKLLLVQQWVATRPNGFLTSSGLASMGTGLPYAIAARLVWPDRPVTAMVGDGGLLMYAGELATVARLNGPFVVIAMNDGALSSIRVKQLRRSYPALGTTLPGSALDLAGLARSLGVDALRVTDRQQLDAALRDGLGSQRPLVIEAIVDPAAYEYSQ